MLLRTFKRWPERGVDQPGEEAGVPRVLRQPAGERRQRLPMLA